MTPNPYRSSDQSAVGKISGPTALYRIISLLGAVSGISGIILALMPLARRLVPVPQWMISVALVGFAVPLGLNGCLLIYVLGQSVFRKTASTVTRWKLERTPPWKSPRQIDAMHNQRWFETLSARLEVADKQELVIPNSATFLIDAKTGQHWLKVMGSHGFATYDLLIPTTLDQLSSDKNPFADQHARRQN